MALTLSQIRAQLKGTSPQLSKLNAGVTVAGNQYDAARGGKVLNAGRPTFSFSVLGRPIGTNVNVKLPIPIKATSPKLPYLSKVKAV